MVASEGGVARGGLVLGIFGLGAAIPLVAVAYASRSWLYARARLGVVPHRARTLWFCVVARCHGGAILTGSDKWLEAQVLQWLPDSWVNLTIGV
ncbi:MAG: hypothetical protein U1B30_01935 [Pseudomonadota bacterium]|nr:hypothetical protein [Pseudomonadota bacterium]